MPISISSDTDKLYIDEFDYSLPDERIAKYPLQKRDDSKLLVYKNGQITESRFYNLSTFLPEKSLLVYNNTRVIQARLHFTKSTGANIEIFCLEPSEPADYSLALGATGACVWKCMVGNLKKWKSGKLIKSLSEQANEFELSAELLKSEGNTHYIQFCWNNPSIHFATILELAGELPIPPYLHRKTEKSDLTNYQTVYSKIKGSVAAPTAGLHFTDDVFTKLKTKEINIEEVTLHVGAGTFQPVKTRDVTEHHMHTEIISVNRDSIQNLLLNFDKIIAVGTTTVRTLESLYHIGNSPEINKTECLTNFKVTQWQPYQTAIFCEPQTALQNIIDYMDKFELNTIHAETQIMIKPGYQFRLIKGMITNFHQPKSTLLLLVSAFVRGKWKFIYDFALANNFRFLSYGDSSLLFL